MKRAEKAKRKAESAASEGEVVAVESDDSRQGVAQIETDFYESTFSQIFVYSYFIMLIIHLCNAFQKARVGENIGTREQTTGTPSSTDSGGASIHGQIFKM